MSKTFDSDSARTSDDALNLALKHSDTFVSGSERAAYLQILEKIETGSRTEAAQLATELLHKRSSLTPEPRDEGAIEAKHQAHGRNYLCDDGSKRLRGRTIYISYSTLDDEAPPGSPKERGFVAHLLRQLRWELSQLGVQDELVWQDPSRIEPGDNWSDATFKALNDAELFVAILSRNYIASDRCKTELSTMASHLGAAAGQGRIFRVDKNSVPEDAVPETFRRVQAVRFYSESDEEDNIDEFYRRGKVQRPYEYEGAVNKLAKAIRKRLRELEIPLFEVPVNSKPRSSAARPKKAAVFVAKPASDMIEPYRALVWELSGRGYRVTPDPDKDLSDVGEAVQSTVAGALEDAAASIHLLGQRKGGRPDGLDMELVPMQLAAAADETRRRPDFVRMIWAPKVLMLQTSAEARDPLKVVEGFGMRLDTDLIDGDTASRFTEHVLQRLERSTR
jgi:hypothetical protein